MHLINFIASLVSLLISLCFSVQIRSHIKVMGSCNIISMEVVCGLNLVLEFYSEFIIFVRNLPVFEGSYVLFLFV